VENIKEEEEVEEEVEEEDLPDEELAMKPSGIKYEIEFPE